MADKPIRRVRRKTATAAPSKSGGGGRSTAKRARLSKDEAKEKVPASQGYDATEDDIIALLPKGLSRTFVSSKLSEKTKLIQAAGLEPVSDYEGEMPEMPDDIDAVSHSELSNLLMKFQAALSTATWQASMAYIEADVYDEIAEWLENRALLNSEQSNDAKRKAEARTNDQVLFFRAKQKEAYHNYVAFRDLGATINGKVKVVSRVGGFKDDEQEGSDRSARPKMSKGGSIRRRRSE